MIMLQILVDRGAQVALTEEHELATTLVLDGTEEALGEGVEVGTTRRQADRG
jgi:hypothetical protein